MNYSPKTEICVCVFFLISGCKFNFEVSFFVAVSVTNDHKPNYKIIENLTVWKTLQTLFMMPNWIFSYLFLRNISKTFLSWGGDTQNNNKKKIKPSENEVICT